MHATTGGAFGGARHEVEPRYSLVGTETTLLVEDQPDVRAVTRDTLSRRGYKMLEAADGVEAMSILENHGSDVGLLLTDASCLE